MTKAAVAEEWRPVRENLDYEVSSLGRVRSLDRIKVYCRGGLTVRRKHRGTLLSPCESVGYPSVNIGRGNPRKVHKLVCEAFHGPRPEGHEVLHGDGDRQNCRAANLRWGTRSENIADAQRHGTQPVARNPRRRRG